MNCSTRSDKKISSRRLLRTAGILALFLILAVSLGGVKARAATTSGWKTSTVRGKRVSMYYKNGQKVTSSFLNLSGKKYLFDSKGYQVTGWQSGRTGGVIRYFYNALGAKGYMATGFQKDAEGNIRYFDPKTGLLARGWTEINGTWRYFDTKSGVLYTGIRKIGKYYYYLMGSSSIEKKGIRCQAGFRKMGSVTYYFNPSDGHAHIGWLTKGGNKYYFNGKGHMYTNTTLTISGKRYNIDADGVVTPVQTTVQKSYKYTNYGSYVTVYDEKNKKTYRLAKEFAEDYGVADGKSTDRDLLAALCESEAGDQGLVGMEAVALCILNRTIKPDKEFPSEIRYVIYHEMPASHYPQYSVVRIQRALNQRLKGNWNNKTLAYQAADEAMKIFNAYVTSGKPRTLTGFNKGKDHNFMYFMMTSSYKALGLTFPYYTYKDHTFFVDWP